MIRTLLVANRGEIARRIFRTARAMGVRCVAVYVDADADAPFVREADEAVRIPTGYLDGPALVRAAQLTSSDAIHPGYGFLAENGGFAVSVIDAGIAWVGPSPEVIETMGDKIAAKGVAIDAGVPTLPSTEDVTSDGEIGYPLLVKAAAGGGGKGMRIVESPSELDEAVAAAKREAAAGFGDDRVFLERYVARSRHVEIQILGDAHGGLLHLGERECSIQRRHQKIIEESPSPVVDEALRDRMGGAALALARALHYESAGTVEFLLDDETREFWFLEVNTRLQVEHPVTEEVTGIDLVREQLRIANGEPLGYEQSAISFSGHAIEARLYAEDPASGFLPAVGELAVFDPAPDPTVRWDTGVETGSLVGVDFDPMLAKVVAHAATRAEAASRLARALERLHLGGVTTNRDFLASTLRTPEFLAGDTTTDFIERVDPPRARPLTDVDIERVSVATALWLQGANRDEAPVLRSMPSGWRNARLPAERLDLAVDGRQIAVHYRAARDGSFVIGPDSDRGPARVHGWSADGIDLEWSERRTSYRVTRNGGILHLTDPLGTVDVRIEPRFVLPGSETPAGSLVAPMPGLVLDLRVSVGDRVEADQTLVVLEAMKMEHHIKAGVHGTVTEVMVEKGQQLENGTLLLVIESDDTSDADAGGQP